jgi:hypothetical protein
VPRVSERERGNRGLRTTGGEKEWERNKEKQGREVAWKREGE